MEQDRDVELVTYNAWLCAKLAMSDPKKFPRLEKLLPGKQRHKSPMRNEDLAHALSQWASVTRKKADG